MRTFNLRKFYKKILFLQIFNCFDTADGIQVEKIRPDGKETTTASMFTTAGWNPWEATKTSVSMTTMTPKIPDDGVNLCSVDAHCQNGGKCGKYCPLIEGLGIGFTFYFLPPPLALKPCQRSYVSVRKYLFLRSWLVWKQVYTQKSNV